MNSNGGFPPLRYIKENIMENKELKKDRFFAPTVKDVDIKHILTTSATKPIIDLNKNDIGVIESF